MHDTLKTHNFPLDLTSSELYEMIELAPVAFCTINPDGLIRSANQYCLRMFGINKSDEAHYYFQDIFTDKALASRFINQICYVNKISNLQAQLCNVRTKATFYFIMSAVVHKRENAPDSVLCFMRDISDLKQRENHLKDYTEQLERSNAELDEFASIVAHDLKQPLYNMILTIKQMIEQSSASNAQPLQREKLEILQSSAQHFYALIEATLAYARLNYQILRLQPIDLNDIADNIIHALNPTLTQRKTNVTIPHRLPALMIDQKAISEVLRNLISNAIKYNDKHNPVVEIGYLANYTRPYLPGRDAKFFKHVIYVKDNGIGIDAMHHQQIFKLFKRLEQSNDYGGGLGLGLAAVAKIVNRMGGDIWLESTLGVGSTFYVGFAS